MSEAPRRPGLFASARGLAATLVETVRIRLELLGTELEEEKLRLVRLLAFGAAAFFLLGAGTVFLAIFLTVLWWEDHRLLAIGLMTGLFLLGGFVALRVALDAARAKSQLFSASLAELTRDRDELREEP